MRSAGLRVEIIRFALLLTLTAGLLAVALHLDHGDGGHRTSSPPAGAPVTPGNGSQSGGAPASGHPGHRAGATDTPAGTAGGGSVAVTSGTLPRTGHADATLSAMALISIVGGRLLVLAGRRRD